VTVEVSGGSTGPATRARAPFDTDRFLRVWKDWSRGWAQGPPSVLFGNPQRTCLFVAALLALVLFVVDLVWWSPGDGSYDLAGDGAYWAVCALGSLLQALMVVRFLRTFDPPRLEIRSWISVARFVLAGMPVAGFLTVPAWRWLVRERPERIGQPVCRLVHPIGLRGCRLGRRLRLVKGATWPRGASPGFPFVLFLTIGLAFLWIPLCALPGLSSAGWSGWLGWGTALSLGGLLHLAGTVAAVTVLAIEARVLGLSPPGARLLKAPALLWLLPIPGAALLGMVYMMALDATPRLRRRERTLVRRSFDRSGPLLERGPWRRLRTELRKRPSKVPWFRLIELQLGELERPRDASRAERRLLRLRRLTMGLLPFEVALAAAWWAAGATPETLPYAELAVTSMLDVGVGALAGLVAVQALRRRRRLPEPRAASFAGALAALGWAGLVVALGGEVGLALGLLAIERVGRALTIGASVGVALTMFRLQLRAVFPPLPGSSEEDDRFAFVLLLLFVAVLGFGIFLVDGRPSGTLIRGLELVVAAVPCAGMLRVLGPIRAVVYPHAPGEILSRRLSRRLRLRLLVLTLAALVPFGGVTVPGWELFRRRLWTESPSIGTAEENPPIEGSTVSIL